MRIIFTCITSLFLLGCLKKPVKELQQGVWRGVIYIQENEVPFNFAILKDSASHFKAYLKNGKENLLLDEIKFEDDSVVMVLHIFDSELKAAVNGDSLKGYFVKNYEKNYRLPFTAVYNIDYRFAPEQDYPNHDSFAGKYQVAFTNNMDTTQAIGLFAQRTSNIVEGTFLTTTGDYRFLEGSIIRDTLHLSTFDGNLIYLFKAWNTGDSTIAGEFWSGKTSYKTWTGVRNENASLPDAEALTMLKDGYDKIEFSFPNAENVLVSPTDEEYKNKVVVLQLLGTWCPNCMDETRFLSAWYTDNKERGIKIIGLAYEARDDFMYASSRVKKMREKMNVEYEVVIAGTKDKESASQSLPMLNKVIAFPTLIFIGKDGKVKRIHTGFSGPGTGPYYQEFVQRFNEIINELLNEKLP